jgi:ubiquinone biosynthesis protein
MDAKLAWDLLVSLPVILGIAWLSGRLLGIARSWAATVLSGVAGWLAALALSLAIASGDTGAPGFTRNLWVFAVVFTMSASVWVELLAKPGTLARARRGLVSVPHPVRAVRRSGRRLSRYAQITGIAVKYGFGPVLGLGRSDDEDLAAQPAVPAARRLRLALEECGGMFVKLGQLLSTRADLLPAGVIAELSRLQDQVAPAPPESVRALLEAELGRPAAEALAELDPEPIAAASIAQAYRGRLRSGEAVVVKVQRPGVAESVDRDLLVLAELAQVAETRTAWGADYHVTELAGEFAERLREELDFRLEARNATEIAAGLTPDDGVRVPAVHAELSTARVLVMEWLDGVSVREIERIDAMGLDRSRPARRPPAGVDAGDAGRLRDQSAAGVLHLLPRPGHPGRDAHHPLAGLPGDRGRRAAGGRVGTGQPRPDLPGRPGPPGARQPRPASAPRAPPAGPHRHPPPTGRPPGQGAAARRRGRRPHRDPAAQPGGAGRAGWRGRVLSVMLLGTQGGPPFTGDTSLFQFFGSFGLFCATVMILRVLVAVLRDGLN